MVQNNIIEQGKGVQALKMEWETGIKKEPTVLSTPQKVEGVEQAAKTFANDKMKEYVGSSYQDREYLRQGFIAGAKWQADNK